MDRRPLGKPHGPIIFVDQFDQEFSRDIEPMKGGHGDNYYWQLVSGVRRYKGAPPLPKASAPVSIRLRAAFDQWHDVQPEFRDRLDETIPRSADGRRWPLHTPMELAETISPPRSRATEQYLFLHQDPRGHYRRYDPNWMWLLINSDQNAATGWEGYDFIVNHTIEADGTSSVESNQGQWQWRKVRSASFRAEGNELQLAIPRAALGLPPGDTRAALDFKWADNRPSGATSPLR